MRPPDYHGGSSLVKGGFLVTTKKHIPVIEKSGSEWRGRVLNMPGYKVHGTREEVESKLNDKIQQFKELDEEQ